MDFLQQNKEFRKWPYQYRSVIQAALDTGGLPVQAHPGLQKKFRDSLGNLMKTH